MSQQTQEATSSATLPNGVAAGDVTQTSAVLWAHSTALDTVTFQYSPRTDWFDDLAHHVLTVEVTDATIPVKVQVSNLQPGTEYVYRVTDAAGSTLSGRFLTLPTDGTKGGLHFGVT